MTARYVQHHRLKDAWYQQNHIRVPQPARPRASKPRRQRKADAQAIETVIVLLAVILAGFLIACI